MAGMTAADSITAASRTQAFTELQESVFYNNELFKLFEHVPMTGGATFNVKHHTTGVAATRYNEGDAAGVPGSQTYATASHPVAYYKRVIQITGHARDQLRNGSLGAAFFDQVALEGTTAMKEVVDLATTDMLGSGTTSPVGLQGLIDSTGTVAGIARSSNTWFAAYEVAIAGGTIALTDFDIVWANVHDAEYASPGIDLILTSWTQIRKVKGLGLNFGTSNPFGLNSTTGNVDLGLGYTGLSYAGAPFIPMRDLTNSVYLFLVRNEVKINVQRGMTVDPLAKTDDSDKFMMTWAGGISVLNPKHHGKLTGA